jgi:hypothetical protein
MSGMETITATLRELGIGEPQHFRNLTAFPLLQQRMTRPDYLTLAKAMNKGTAVITEISEGGSVPELLLDNAGDEKLLVLDGEELLGAKQNRIANLTVLAAANSKTVLPVSCVEHGRWCFRSADVKTSGRTMYHRARAAKAVALNQNLKATGTHGADQGMVWDNIAAKQARMSVRSETSAMADMFDQHETPIEDYTRAFKAETCQVGVLFAIDGEAEGLDLFDAPETFASILPKLVRSFAIDALETANDETEAAGLSTASQFLDRISAANADNYPGVGLGTDLRLTAPLVSGGGLVYEEQLIHLVAFSTQAPPPPPNRNETLYESALRRQRYERMRRRNRDRGE